MTATETPSEIGARVGVAIARSVIAEDMPRGWTGIDPQDADQFAAAGLVYGSPKWAASEAAAEVAYAEYLATR